VPDAWVLLAKPAIHVSTAFVYGNLKADQITDHPDIDGQRAALEAGDLYGMASKMGNVLESVTIPAYPIIDEIKEAMKRSGAISAMMSGSGPTVFGLFEDKAQAQAAYEEISRRGMAKQIFLTRFFHRRGRKSGHTV
jgi:4-diphosphocytidyl-2-C-methyl-D-erythritol kinase